MIFSLAVIFCSAIDQDTSFRWTKYWQSRTCDIAHIVCFAQCYKFLYYQDTSFRWTKYWQSRACDIIRFA